MATWWQFGVRYAAAAWMLECALCWAQSGGKRPELSDLTLEQLANVKVTSASLHEEGIADAPASVTIITAEQIRRFGYRTLAEALSSVRGVYTTSDHTYTSLGIRGFSMPGFETRFLVMINGHNIGENVVESTFVGNDFPLDLDVVDRIEVVRGPSSALYGSDALLMSVNVVTRNPSRAAGESVRMETGSLGEKKAGASASAMLPHEVALLVSGSVFNNAGAGQLYFPEFDAPETNHGRAVGMDGEKGYHIYANLTWKNWALLAVAGDRVKTQPVSWGDTVFNDPGTGAEDSRGFVELAYTGQTSTGRELSWRTSYDAYRYRGIYRYAGADGTYDSREREYGDWITSRFAYRLPYFAAGQLTLGADLKIDLRALQDAFVFHPEKDQIFQIDRPDRSAGIFAQQEWELGRHWEVKAGLRYDWSWLKRNAPSARAALIYKPWDSTDIKFVAARGFRNPSSYDVCFTDYGLTAIANPNLRPETSDHLELDFDHALNSRLRIGTSVYRYRIRDLIEQIYTGSGPAQFINADRVRTAGASFELDAILPRGVELNASSEFQRAVFDSGAVLPNSPGQVSKLRASAPIWRERLRPGMAVQMIGRRNTYRGEKLPRVVLPELVISTASLFAGLALTAGIKNLSNTFYRDPAGLNESVDSMIGQGRTYFLSLTWHSGSEARISRAGSPDAILGHHRVP